MRLFTLVLIIFFTSCFSPTLLESSKPFLVMKRTACYGTCPQYMISIYNDGLIIYNGKLFVDRIGCFSSVISMNQMDSIKMLLNDIEFFSLKEEYLSPITDVPSVILEINIDGKSHKVVDRIEGPDELKQCYIFIDSIAESVSNWSDCQISQKE